MPEYLTVADFLAYDSQMSSKIGRINDGVDAVQEQVNNLTSAFTAYVAETDAYRIQNDKRMDGIDARLDGIDARLDGIDKRLDTLSRELADVKRMVSRGFALIFARLEIVQP